MDFIRKVLFGYESLKKRLKEDLSFYFVPSGTVMWFFVNEIPDRDGCWKLCDGKYWSRDGKRWSLTYDKDNYPYATPSLIGRYPLGAAEGDVGSVVSAGLPNITGKFRTEAQTAGSTGGRWVSGAFAEAHTGSSHLASRIDPGDVTGYTFDASRCSTVYGRSDTVTPPSVKLLPCIKLNFDK